MKGFLYMAISKGQVSTEGEGFKRYIGVAPVNVIAVNPTKEELSKIYNREIENEPVYVKDVESNGKTVRQVRVDFIVKTADTCVDSVTGQHIDFISRITFFINNDRRVSRTGKIQVIDNYGRTSWVTEEQLATHAIPLSSKGTPLRISNNYRPVYNGEEDLTNFIKTFLNIPNPERYVNETWLPIEDQTVAEVRLDRIPEYFNGNISEIKEAINYQPNNKVKVLFGVKTGDDNKQFQAVYTQMVLRNSVNDYSKLDADVQERKQAGAYPTTEFEVVPLKEYVVKPTSFAQSSDNPSAIPPAFNPFMK